MSKIAFLFLTRDNVHHPDIWKRYFKGHQKKINIYCHPKEPEKVTVDWQKKHIIPNLVETGWVPTKLEIKRDVNYLLRGSYEEFMKKKL